MIRVGPCQVPPLFRRSSGLRWQVQTQEFPCCRKVAKEADVTAEKVPKRSFITRDCLNFTHLNTHKTHINDASNSEKKNYFYLPCHVRKTRDERNNPAQMVSMPLLHFFTHGVYHQIIVCGAGFCECQAHAACPHTRVEFYDPLSAEFSEPDPESFDFSELEEESDSA